MGTCFGHDKSKIVHAEPLEIPPVERTNKQVHTHIWPLIVSARDGMKCGIIGVRSVVVFSLIITWLHALLGQNSMPLIYHFRIIDMIS